MPALLIHPVGSNNQKRGFLLAMACTAITALACSSGHPPPVTSGGQPRDGG